MAHSIYDVLGIIADFDEANVASQDKKSATIRHLQQMDKINFIVPNFANDLDWLNVSANLSFDEHLKGKLVVLDFFTYCCINCMHILPDLEAVEEIFPISSGVAVVGVHSAKFLNEKVTANILSAVLRYNIHHPVVNDKDAALWQALGVSCWPTLLFVGPKGQLLYSVVGEGHGERVLDFLSVATEYYSKDLNAESLPMSLEKNKVPTFKLKFPGKICAWPERNWLVVSDTSNHRIVITDTKGIVQYIVGSGQQGSRNGSFIEAEFSSPQGVTCDDMCIYVADTNNHLLRQIEFDGFGGKVTTLAGTGDQGTDKSGGKTFTDQELASPWDVSVCTLPNGTKVLLIAMAGTHQIWAFLLEDGIWYDNKSYPKGTCLSLAGSGHEENRNNAYPEKAGFAQPSGLAVSEQESGTMVYVADSESSSIRSVSLENRKVSNVVGGERDPTNLFAYGDTEGKGCDAKLQHPLGVAVLDDILYVADSYNHKIKCVYLNKCYCENFSGTGDSGTAIDQHDRTKCQFNEPGGVAVDRLRNLLYIADTNNHSIKVVDLSKKSIFELPIIFPKNDDENQTQAETNPEPLGERMALPEATAKVSDKKIQLTFTIQVSPDGHLNADSPNKWSVSGSDAASKQFVEKLGSASSGAYTIQPKDGNAATAQKINICLTWPDGISPGTYTLNISLKTYECKLNSSTCAAPLSHNLIQPIKLT